MAINFNYPKVPTQSGTHSWNRKSKCVSMRIKVAVCSFLVLVLTELENNSLFSEIMLDKCLHIK